MRTISITVHPQQQQHPQPNLREFFSPNLATFDRSSIIKERTNPFEKMIAALCPVLGGKLSAACLDVQLAKTTEIQATLFRDSHYRSSIWTSSIDRTVISTVKDRL